MSRGVDIAMQRDRGCLVGMGLQVQVEVRGHGAMVVGMMNSSQVNSLHGEDKVVPLCLDGVHALPPPSGSSHSPYYATPPSQRGSSGDDHQSFLPPPPSHYPDRNNSAYQYDQRSKRDSYHYN